MESVRERESRERASRRGREQEIAQKAETLAAITGCTLRAAKRHLEAVNFGYDFFVIAFTHFQ